MVYFQTDIRECSNRIAGAEQGIATAEDKIHTLQQVVEKLERMAKLLNDKAEDLEGRSRHSYIRILGVPEREEDSDPCFYMEKWMADVSLIWRTSDLH